MMELIGPSRKALGVFTILLSFIQVTTSGRALLTGKKIKRNSIMYFFCVIHITIIIYAVRKPEKDSTMHSEGFG